MKDRVRHVLVLSFMMFSVCSDQAWTQTPGDQKWTYETG